MGILYKHGCSVENAKLGVQLLNVQWSENNLYPVEFSKIEQVNMVVKSEALYLLWHWRYGHLNAVF